MYLYLFISRIREENKLQFVNTALCISVVEASTRSHDVYIKFIINNYVYITIIYISG